MFTPYFNPQPCKGNKKGQAIVEYILVLSIVAVSMGVFAVSMRDLVNRMWQVMACEVAAPCAECPPDQSVRNKISTGCR